MKASFKDTGGGGIGAGSGGTGGPNHSSNSNTSTDNTLASIKTANDNLISANLIARGARAS